MLVRTADLVSPSASPQPLTRRALRQARQGVDQTPFSPPNLDSPAVLDPFTSSIRALERLSLEVGEQRQAVVVPPVMDPAPSAPLTRAQLRAQRGGPVRADDEALAQAQLQPTPAAVADVASAQIEVAHPEVAATQAFKPIAVETAGSTGHIASPARPKVSPTIPKLPAEAASNIGLGPSTPAIAPTASFDEYLGTPILRFRPVPQTPQTVTPPVHKRAARSSLRLPTLPLSALWAAHQHRAAAARSEVLDGVSFFARRSMRPLTAVAAAAAVATMVYAQAPQRPATADDPTMTMDNLELNALTPLRDTVEAVSRLEVGRQVSRSGSRAAAGQLTAADVTRRSDSTITLAWTNPELAAGDQMVVRRARGTKPPKTIKDGEAVALNDPQAELAVDSGLTPNKTYSYTVFVVPEGAKPHIATTINAKTRRHPIELLSGGSLVPGEKLVSPNGDYSMAVTSDGKLELYNELGLRIWTPSIAASGGRAMLVMDSDGALQLLRDDEVIWSTSTDGNAQASLHLTNEGDIQVRLGKKILWHRGSAGDISYGDDYPFHYGSPLAYSPNNCTDFVAWRLNKYAGITSAPWRYRNATMTPGGGNAVQWVNYYPNQTDNNPALGAVAWWGTGGGGRGHVAIVTAVHDDGSITIEEYNYLSRHSYGKRHLYPGSHDYPQRFIHINDL